MRLKFCLKWHILGNVEQCKGPPITLTMSKAKQP